MKLMDLANSLIPSVLKAGNIIMEIYCDEITHKIKTDGSPVTEADKAAERIILSELHRLVPEILVVSEEAPESHSKISKEKFFLVDPLDGTKEFLKKDGKGNVVAVQHKPIGSFFFRRCCFLLLCFVLTICL